MAKKRKYVQKTGPRIKKNIGTLIREERESQGKTIEECCAIAGIASSHWSAVERAAKADRMGLVTADRIAYGLGKSVMFFMSKK